MKPLPHNLWKGLQFLIIQSGVALDTDAYQRRRPLDTIALHLKLSVASMLDVELTEGRTTSPEHPCRKSRP